METYNISLVVGQPFCSYPGEFFPRVIAAVDEFTLEDVPEAIEEEVTKATDSKCYSDIRVVNVKLPEEAILDLFKTPSVEGKID